eukprot:2210054-Lingulodinium_polyedra.AAC.1
MPCQDRLELQHGHACNMRLRFPAKDVVSIPRTWEYKCLVCWGPLVEEAAKRPDDSMLQGWVEKLAAKWGTEVSRWPK